MRLMAEIARADVESVLNMPRQRANRVPSKPSACSAKPCSPADHARGLQGHPEDHSPEIPEPMMALVNVHTHSLFDEFVEAGGTIVDLGANIGSFSSQMVERYGSRCVAFEPVPQHFSRISDEIEAYNLAVAALSGYLKFNVSAQADASSFGKAPGIAYTDTSQSKDDYFGRSVCSCPVRAHQSPEDRHRRL